MKDIQWPDVEAALAEINDPLLDLPLSGLGAITGVEIEGSQVALTITLGYPGDAGAIGALVKERLLAVPGVETLALEVDWEVPASRATGVAGVKHIIAVASGKGGVGKSTTAVNLALALSALGARVGILDADIYGPSVPQMLGIGSRRPAVAGETGAQQMLPIEAHGIQSISMGYLVTEQTPMVWRGPMASGALKQLLTQTRWDDVDYLIIDMPPGTGDIQLTLSQSVPVSGAVIVTTPQDIALLDAQKGIEMFRKVSVPVLGIVENMAVHVCSECGHKEPIFGTGGGERIAAEYDTRLLGSLPLALPIRVQTDSGTPTVVADPEGPHSLAYRAIAERLAAFLWQQSHAAAPAPVIEIGD